MATITGSDLSEVNSLARRHVTGADPKALDRAAEFLASCISPEEEARVLWWWNEGSRDYATDMDHLDELNALLPARRAQLFPGQ